MLAIQANKHLPSTAVVTWEPSRTQASSLEDDIISAARLDRANNRIEPHKRVT
jgi:hypothetical protein